MSIQAMAWAIQQRDVTDASARHVLLCLANYADHEGRGAFPSVQRLADETGLSERSVQYKLGALEEAGAIVRGDQRMAEVYISRGDRRPVVYDIPAIARGAEVAPRSATGCKPRQNGVQMKTERGARVAPDPSSNHQVTNTLPREGETPAGFACRLMRAAGCLTTNPSHQRLIDALNEGVDPQALADTVREVIDGGTNERDAFAHAIGVARGRNRDAKNPRNDRGNPHATPARLSASEQTRAAVANLTGYDERDVIEYRRNA